MDTSYAVGNAVIEWTYRVQPAEFRAFTSFLADNEAMIAASCGKLMRGRALSRHVPRHRPWGVEFRTYWAYDTSAAEKQSDKALANPSSNFARAVAQRAPTAQGFQRFAPAHNLGALLGDRTLGAFFKFTLDAAEGGGTAAAKTAATHKKK